MMQRESEAIHALSVKIEKFHDDRRDEEASALADVSQQVPPLNVPLKVRQSLRGHFGKIYAMHWCGAVDPTTLVSASQDGKLIVWNALSGNMKTIILIRSAWVMTVAYAPSGKYVACGGLDNLCTVYHLQKENDASHLDHKLNCELGSHEGYLSCCRFIDDTKIVTSSGDSTCILWDVPNQRPITQFKGHEADVMNLSLMPSNPNVFVSGACDATAKLWDIREATHQTAYGHESDINSVCFTPSGGIPTFATGSDDSSCRLFDTRSVSSIQKYDDGIITGVTSVAMSYSGRTLFAGYDDHNTLAWDTLKGTICKANQVAMSKAHFNRVSCVGVSSDGNALCTGSWDTTLKIWA